MTHIPGKELAKVVMVILDGRMCMTVMPATRKLDLERLRQAANAGEARLPGEEEFRRLFPDCETGAMPPFGNLYGMDVYVSPELAEDKEIAFNAGSHTELINLGIKDPEDALQIAAAMDWQASFIITGNVRDFKRAPIPALAPAAWIKRFEPGLAN